MKAEQKTSGASEQTQSRVQQAAPAEPAGRAEVGEGQWRRAWRTLYRLGPLGILGVVSVALPPLSGGLLIVYMKTVAEWLRGHQLLGVMMYAGAFAALSGLAVLPTYAQAALGGFAFGMGFGLPAALLGFAGGALIGYVIARVAGGDRATALLRENPKWLAVRDALVRDRDSGDRGSGGGFWKTVWMVALLRMPPNSPFALTNLVMASVKVPMARFAVGTVLGMIPRTAAAVWLGATVGLSQSGEFKSPGWLLYGGLVLGMLVLMVVLDVADRAVQKITTPERVQTMRQSLPTKLVQGAVIAAVVIGMLMYFDHRREERKAAEGVSGIIAPQDAPMGESGQPGQ